MDNAFRAQDKMFQCFLADEPLCTLFGITDITDMTLVDAKIRRVAADTTVIDPSDTDVFPFFDFTFIPMYGVTCSKLVYRSTLEFNLYTSELGQAQDIFEAIKRILDDNYEETYIKYQGQGSSGIKDIYKYVFRVNLLVSS
jgi:hypothetical protein